MMRSIRAVVPRNSRELARAIRQSSTTALKEEKTVTEDKKPEVQTELQTETKIRAKTQSELDKELQDKMAGLAGDGGDAGLELENGKAVSMKRGVRENMFRYI